MRKKRKKDMKKIKADKVIKTLNWIANENKINSLSIQAIPNVNTYVCKIYLPRIDKSVIGIGEDKISSIDSATQQTAKLIDQYLASHPNTAVRKIFKEKEYILQEDDQGHLSVRIVRKGDDA